MMNNKGVLGEFIITFIATIAIVIIILVFIFGSSIIKMIDKNSDGTRRDVPQFSQNTADEIKNDILFDVLKNCRQGEKVLIFEESFYSKCLPAFVIFIKNNEKVVCSLGKCYYGKEAGEMFSKANDYSTNSLYKKDYINNGKVKIYDYKSIVIWISYLDIFSEIKEMNKEAGMYDYVGN